MLFSNILGFDGIILLVSVVNVFILMSCIKSAINLEEFMYPRGSVDWEWNEKSKEELEKKNKFLDMLFEKRRRCDYLYNFYHEIIEILPLMGTFGTVISLLNLAVNIDGIESNFFAALTSTFFGLLFAITFKALDALVLAPKLHKNEQIIEYNLNKFNIKE